jgi:poly-beta-1,6-N-acetyl-D-glucosamine synthase
MAEVKLLEWLLLVPLVPYTILILYLLRGFSGTGPAKLISSPSVSVSVIIACRDEEDSLPELLGDLSVQDYDSSLFEVIVVDDNSTDRTAAVAANFRGIGRLHVLPNRGRGKKSAIRTGADQAIGELLITTDADCRVKEGWIRSLAECYSEEKSDMLISPVVLRKSSGLLGSFQELEFMSLQGITAASALLKKPVLCNGANLAFSASAYRKNEAGLKEKILSGDDIFLLQSIKRAKGSIRWNGNTESTVVTAGMNGPGSFLRQRARWLSKSGSFNDTFTVTMALAALFANLALAALLAGSIALHSLLIFWLAAFVIKSVPDFLLLQKICSRYKNEKLLRWFIPSQFIYPFYVLIVSVFSVFRRNRW